MDRAEFIDKMQFNLHIDTGTVLDIVDKSIVPGGSTYNPGDKNLIIVMEELSELAKEVAKYLRGKGDKMDMLQEMADVQLGIYYLMSIVGITPDELKKAVSVKSSMTLEILSRNGQYT